MSDNGIQQTKGYEITYKEDGVYLLFIRLLALLTRLTRMMSLTT